MTCCSGCAIAAIAALTLGCAGGSDDPSTAATNAPTDTVSTDTAPTDAADATPATTTSSVLLPGPTTHLGLTWFSPPDPDTADTILERWDEAQRVSSVGRVLIDWIEVEPERGDYRFDELAESLRDLTDAGLAPMVTIAAVDLSGTEFPSWLGSFDPVAAADAYAAMIERVLPMLRDHEVWLLAIANEPPLAADDDLDRGEFATFVEVVTDRLDDVAPDLAVTFTFAGGDSLLDDPAIERMRLAGDALSVNHYCLDASLTALALGEATARIDEYVEAAGDLPVVFQEFGCPAGEANGSSDVDQLAWFEVAFEHIASIEQVRAAFVFEFLDWSPTTFELGYGDAVAELEAEVGEAFVERFRSWLLTSGLVRNDGTTRPAFDHFLDVASR